MRRNLSSKTTLCNTLSSRTPHNDRKFTAKLELEIVKRDADIMTKKICIFTAVFMISFSLSSGQESVDIGGYIKNMSSYQDGSFAGTPDDLGDFQNTVQTRLNISWYPLSTLTAGIESRHLFIYQKNIKTGGGFMDIFAADNYYFDLKEKWSDENDFQAVSEIDRLYLDWTLDNLQITLGRQRIAWGSALVWNPTDLFNPFNILDFDYLEKPGTDALYMQYYLGPLSQLDIAVSPGRKSEEVIYAVRYYFNFNDYDFNIIGGWQKKTFRLGAGWSGQLYGGGLRGEMLYSKPEISYETMNTTGTLPAEKKIDDPYFTVVISYDYTFRNSFYWHTEYMYNGLGAVNNSSQRRLEILQSGELTPSRHSIFQEFSYDITPLWKGNVYIIFNPSDQSWIAAPSLQYSMSDNWELYLTAFPSAGKLNSEFGDMPGWYFCRFKYSF